MELKIKDAEGPFESYDKLTVQLGDAEVSVKLSPNAEVFENKFKIKDYLSDLVSR